MNDPKAYILEWAARGELYKNSDQKSYILLKAVQTESVEIFGEW